MKKILRLVTTSVLTLTLVACGEASSSVSNGTNTSSSVASTTSAFANVTSVTLTAASDTLTQTLGTQKTVVVQATLNSGTNPSAALEWFVNGTKSNQTGRVFEYTPSTSGTFKIQARVGSVSSNELTLTVGSGTLTITKLTVVDNNTIRVQAPGGAQVTLTNNVLLPESKYDLKTGEYVLELETALTQGQSTTVTLTRDGSSVSQVATFDTRVLAVSSVSGGPAGTVKDNKDGTYDVLRPHTLGSTEVTNTTVATYSVSFEATNMRTTSTSFTFENSSAPVGVTLRPSFTSNTQITGNTKSPAGSFTFSLNKDSTPGAYVYRFTVGGVTRTVTINVIDPAPIVDFVPYFYDGDTLGHTTALYASEAAADLGTDYASTAEFNLLMAVNSSTFNIGLTPGTDGAYAITKPYLKLAAQFKSFKFDLEGMFFDVPTNVMDQSGVNSNQLQLSVSSPDGLPIMRTQYKDGGQETLPTLAGGFRSGFDGLSTVTQHLDAATPAGIYTYTVRVLQSGAEIYKREIKVKIVEPTADLALRPFVNNATTSWETATSNLLDTLKYPARTSIVASIKGATDSDTEKANYSKLKALFFSPLVPKVSGFDIDTYESAKSAFVAKFLQSDGKVVTSADTAAELRTLLSPFALNVAQDDFESTSKAATLTTLGSLLETDVFTRYLSILDTVVDEIIVLYGASLSTASPSRLETFASKFPTYEQWISAGRSTLKIGADGVYEIEKPLTQLLDTKTVMFDLRISNFESPTSAGSNLANQFNGTNVTSDTTQRKDLLAFTKSVSGPGLLPNNSFNTTDTKIALELGVGANTAGEEVANLAQPTPDEFSYYASAITSSRVDLTSVFALDTRFLTVNGEYTFNVAVGTLNQTVKVRVVSAKVDLTFEIDEDESDFVYNEEDEKYYANFNYDADPLEAEFNIVFKNITVPTSGSMLNKVEYNLVKAFPLKTETFRNTLLTTSANTGTNVNNGFRTVDSSDEFLDLITTSGETHFEITTFGEYVFELTVAGVKKTVTLVAQKYPTIEITEITNGTDVAGSFYDEEMEETVYVLTESFETITILGEAVTLPINVYYALDYDVDTDNYPVPLNDLTVNFVDDFDDIVDDAGLILLDLASGLEIELFNDDSDGLLDGDVSAGKIVYVYVHLYTIELNGDDSTPVVALYDVKFIGHLVFKVWYLGDEEHDNILSYYSIVA
jgi:hypothetical protein